MVKTYFLTAIRNFRKNKLFSFINIGGLAIGISSALVIYLIVQYEYNFDTFHKDRDRIYRVVSTIHFPDLLLHNSGLPVPTVEVFKKEGTGIDKSTFFFSSNPSKLAIPSASGQSPLVIKRPEKIVYADENYFNFFEYHWIAGSPEEALKEPFRVVLTESLAKSYFGSGSPRDIIGKTIIYEDSILTTVSGIVKELPGNTDLQFNEFISKATVERTGLKNNWGWDEWGSVNSASQFFVKLSKGIKPSQIEKQLAALRQKNIKDKSDKDFIVNTLQPLADIHFNHEFDAIGNQQASKPILAGLLGVAIFLLLLGCINFINLTTAQSTQRAKEIGIRKTLGSGKRHLVFQFLGETCLLTIGSTLLSVAITPWLLTIFSDFIPKGVSLESVNQWHVWLFLFLLVIVVSILSGLYPGWVLTRFRPVAVLKNQTSGGSSKSRKAWVRKTLTVTQFVIAQFLIIAVLVLSRQIHYSLSKSLGYKKDAIVYFETPWNFFSDKPDQRRFTLYNKLKTIPEIESVSLSGDPPASKSTSTTTMKFDDGKKISETMVEIKYADTNYFNLYQMKLVAGKLFQQSDTVRQYIINETYAKFLGFNNPADVVGKFIDRDFKVQITGVIKDFHSNSTHMAIKPLAYASAMNNSYTMHLGLGPHGKDGKNWKLALEKAEKAFKDVYPGEDFKYEFFDQTIANFYKTEQNILRLLKWATGLCIFISCLGLFGLVIFTTNLRVKEIGVRKVLGASAFQIVSLLSKDFVSLVLIAFLISAPLAWLAMNRVLQEFAYRTNISWWIFAVCALTMTFLALVVLSIRTIRAAMANPVGALRSE